MTDDKSLTTSPERAWGAGVPSCRDEAMPEPQEQTSRDDVIAVQGHKDDAGKSRLDLVPPEAVFALGDVLGFGATKYKPRNWEKGINYGRVFGAAMRHLWAWWRGEQKDPETGFSHLWHALTCIAFLVAYESRGMDQFDDRPSSKGD